MQVLKRNNRREEVKLDKVTRRAKSLSEGLKVDPVTVAQKAVSGIYDGITTQEIDTLLAETAAAMTTDHPDYSNLAARVAVSSLHKDTEGFYLTMKRLYKDGYLSDEFIELVKKHGRAIDKKIDYERDFNFDYFGYKTLERSYLQRIDKKIVERPQDLYMRVALAIAGDSIKEAFELYDLLSQGHYTHATPTLFNAGTRRPQMSSCFLIAMKEDSVEGIYDTAKECAIISKNAGGVGLHIHNIRATGSLVKGTNGISKGVVPMLQVFNSTFRFIDQGGKRKGAAAIYLEPWHADIEGFLELRKNNGKEEFRTRDLHLALWTPDLFMKRVEEDGLWTLMCPNECPGLSDVWGSEFEALYTKYEDEKKGRRTMKARDLMMKIMEVQIEGGEPFMLFKDACNSKSNQQHSGVIKSSNLCTEILEISNAEETAVCNLASIALPMAMKKVGDKWAMDHKVLHNVARIAIKNLNRVIDKNYYPTEPTRRSNTRHRPVGLGVQGLADVFFKAGIAYDSPEAAKLNRDIFETLYHAAVEMSCELAEKEGAYETFKGSPISKGKFQFDLWGVTPSNRYDWEALRKRVQKSGLRNSLLLAPMPTASTSQILSNLEGTDAQGSNLFKRITLAGEFAVINRYLVKDLEKLGLWNSEMRDAIVAQNGSVQNVNNIPAELKAVYKTVWEISQKSVIDMAADRGAFICQSQSMNLYLATPNFGNLNSMLFYGWKKGLKTGMYYLRSKAALNAQKVTVKIPTTEILKATAVTESVVPRSEKSERANMEAQKLEALICSLENPEACVACGS